MSLKYRLIILTILVFALTFGVGTLLGARGARRLAEGQLRSHLRDSAAALAGSAAPLNDEVLDRLAPLLDAHIVVLRHPAAGQPGRVVAHSGGDWPWESLSSRFLQGAQLPNPTKPLRAAGGRRYYFSRAGRYDPVTGVHAVVLLFADEEVVRQPAQTILRGYLIILGVTAAGLAVGMYILGLGLVGRIKRLNRTVDATLSEEHGVGKRRGDELRRLSSAFDDLVARLQRSRERLAAQQALATTGKIASSVAHEVRNPLQAMKLIVQMLREKCPPDDREGCDLVLAEIDRLGLLTDELLVLAGTDTLRVEPVDLAAELRETVRLLRLQFRQREIRVEIGVSLDPDAVERPTLPTVAMDRNRCRQLLLNLLLNAAEASPHGAVVQIEADVGADGVAVRIIDSGPGFPKDVLDGQAEEFFSTKTSGAGLGLSICRRIVTEAGGRLKLYNTDTGAVAEVVLPVAG